MTELDRYKVLDTLPEKSFDDITLLAAEICQTPIALVSLVDKERQWFKSRHGIDATQTSRSDSFCSHAILENELFVVNDTFQDKRFFDNPLVLNDPEIRFYAGAPLTTSSGENVGTICVIDKIPRELTQAQQNCLAALSRQVIAQLELRLDLQEEKTLTQAKSLFLANISHEIRTPMNAISCCIELLIDVIEEKEQLELLTLTRDATNSLMTLINEILGISKLEFDKISVRDSTFNLHMVAEDTVRLLSTRAKQLERAIVLEVAECVPQLIIGDPDRVRQLLYNLAGNALKFCSNKVVVSFDLKKSGNDDTLLIEVKDDGMGITAENQKRIFQQFTQASTGEIPPEGGTGLGLAICENLCRAMQGTIWVDSSPGNGATFSIELPLRVAEQVKGVHQQRKLSSIDSKMGEKFPLRLLVAEDSEVNQFLVETMLEKLGYSVDLVSDGREAVDASQRGDYDVILMDIRMPNVDGIEATQEIRKSAIRQPAIIALTANAFEEDKADALAAGMNGFITKPINLESLADAIGSAGGNSVTPCHQSVDLNCPADQTFTHVEPNY
ncbi:MAG: response regulator [Halioglobus sp.]